MNQSGLTKFIICDSLWKQEPVAFPKNYECWRTHTKKRTQIFDAKKDSFSLSSIWWTSFIQNIECIEKMKTPACCMCKHTYYGCRDRSNCQLGRKCEIESMQNVRDCETRISDSFKTNRTVNDAITCYYIIYIRIHALHNIYTRCFTYFSCGAMAPLEMMSCKATLVLGQNPGCKTNSLVPWNVTISAFFYWTITISIPDKFQWLRMIRLLKTLNM